MTDLEGIVARLHEIDEELSDASIAILSDALHGEPDAEALALEKKITRARRSISKASGLLGAERLEQSDF